MQSRCRGSAEKMIVQVDCAGTKVLRLSRVRCRGADMEVQMCKGVDVVQRCRGANLVVQRFSRGAGE